MGTDMHAEQLWVGWVKQAA